MKYIGPRTLLRRLLDAGVGKEPLLRPRLLGVDFGEKCTGLSFTDSHNRHGLPLTVLDMEKENIEEQAEQMKEHIREKNIYGIVFGYPRGIFVGNSTPTGKKIVKWVAQLDATKKLGDIEYTYWDEGFTTRKVEGKLPKFIIDCLRDPAVDMHASGFIVETLLRRLRNVRAMWVKGVEVNEDESL